MKESQYYGGSDQEAKDSRELDSLRAKARERGYTIERKKKGIVTIKINPCRHPPARIYSWFVGDVLCAGCCVCGEVLAGGVE